MKEIVHDFHTDVIPSAQEVKDVCKPGEADCCIQLVMGSDGFECMALNRMPIVSVLDRYAAGDTNAKRCGCEHYPADWGK
jgi:hypothetical protein